jgi:NAD(P)-dependent dehydrogenase (short-subunit alcohol dehydrogenase family)
VIVFGPTGAVGRAVAIEASKRGAKVWLAMRTTDKAINGINREDEERGAFQRVQADLFDPESVVKAVKESGAKAVG